jgi:hypothetical protein
MERWLDIADVEAIRETRSGLLCRIAGKEVAVPFAVIRADSQVWRWGDRGVLTLPFWFATDVVSRDRTRGPRSPRDRASHGHKPDTLMVATADERALTNTVGDGRPAGGAV